MSSMPLLQQGWGLHECPREAVTGLWWTEGSGPQAPVRPALTTTTITPKCSPVPSSLQQTMGNGKRLSAHLSHQCLLLNTSFCARLTDSTQHPVR